MDDDFNTPGAVAVLFDLASSINRGHQQDAASLKALGAVMGFLQQSPNAYLKAGASSLDAQAIEVRIIERNAARPPATSPWRTTSARHLRPTAWC